MGVHDVAVFVFGVIDVGVRAINIALGVVGQVGDVLDLVGVQLFVELQAADLEKLVLVVTAGVVVGLGDGCDLLAVGELSHGKYLQMLFDVCLWFPCVYIIAHKWEQVNRQDNIFTLICEYMGKRKAAAERPSSGPYRATLLARSVRAARKSSSFARRSLLSKMESTISRMV